MQGRRPSREALVFQTLLGLLVVACISVAIVVWRSPNEEAARLSVAEWMEEPVSTSSVSVAKKELPAQPASPNLDMAKRDAASQVPSPQAQTALRPPPAPSISPELTQWLQTIVRELTNLQQGIELLKTNQAQMVRDNADFAERLKETREQISSHNSELVDSLKTAHAEMVRDYESTAEQLKASQEKLANIGEQLKATQEQMDRLVTSEQQWRPKALASTQAPTFNPRRKLAPTPRARAVPQNSEHLQQTNQY